MMRRFLTVTLLAAMVSALSAVPAIAQSFPSKTVTIVVPYTPGGGVDTVARTLARGLSKLWGQSVIIKNLPGAGSIIGAEKVANARPDGYTLLVTLDTTVVSNRFLYKHLPYNPDKSLTPITMLARSSQFVVANPSVHANSLRELVAAARRAPDSIAYSSAGVGSHPNLFFATIGKREGVKFLHVPYKGVVQELRAVLSGRVQTTLAIAAKAGPFLKAGKVKALAIDSLHRSNLFPKVPTVGQEGYGYAANEIWWGLFAPGGTSAKLVDRINHDVRIVARRSNFEKFIKTANLHLVADTPAEFSAAIRDDVKVTGEMVKAAGIQPK